MGAYCQTEVRQYRAIQGYGVLRAFGAAHQLSAALTVPCASGETLTVRNYRIISASFTMRGRLITQISDETETRRLA